MLVDTHCHLNDPKYENVDNVIQNFLREGISRVFCVGYDMQSSQSAIEIAKKYDCVYAIIGIHPENAIEATPENLQKLKQMCKCSKVIAIGEIGFDYHYAGYNKELQQNAFVAQVKLAHELGLPVCIHTRDAIGDTINILQSHATLLTNGGVLHCFSESYEVYLQAKALGLKISFGGPLTFKNAKHAPEIVEKMDLSDLILETDCPYLTPEPYRGQCINEPKFVKLVYEKVCTIRHIGMDTLCAQINKNIEELFHVPLR